MEEYKILWIDDDIDKPELMPDCSALAKKGCNITPISKVDKLKITKNMLQMFHCIILDLNMPVWKESFKDTLGGLTTGYTILQKIKKRCPDSKVVVYSNHEVSEVRGYCNRYSIEYWKKSDVSPDTFADKIINFINN
jgi:CheY-like chemotaxis protein